jgi:hypothetical protein
MDQDTPWPEISLFTEAEIGCESPACTLAVAGVAITVTAGTVIITELAAEGSASEVAVTVTLRSLAGGAVGAM